MALVSIGEKRADELVKGDWIYRHVIGEWVQVEETFYILPSGPKYIGIKYRGGSFGILRSVRVQVAKEEA